MTKAARRLVGRGGPGEDLHRLDVTAQLTVRAPAASGASERIVEGLVIPFGQVATVQDRPGGPRYRETVRSVARGLDPGSVLLESIDAPIGGQLHDGARLVGRGIAGEERPDGYWMAFRVAKSRAGDDTLALAEDGILGRMSIVFRQDPAKTVRRADGVLERSDVEIARVAILERGAYPGAVVTAVRADTEDQMKTCPDCGAQLQEGAAHTCPKAPAPAQPAQPSPAASGDGSGTDRAAPGGEDAARAAAERQTVAAIAPQGPRAMVTREAAIYGPGTGRSFFGDLFRASPFGGADSAAAERVERHYRMLDDIDRQIQRSISIDQELVGRAGEVLSSEIPGAYPSEYLPGLIVNRILKARPMAGFYQRVPIADGTPKLFPVVSTSTSVAVQASEGTNAARSDFATTQTSVTPLFYGGETLVSRQVLDGADPSIDAMLQTDLTEAYMQASETVVKTAVEAGSTASGVTLTAATPNIGTINLILNYFQNVFLPAERLFLPTTLYSSWLTQLDTTGRPLAPYYGPTNASGQVEAGMTGAIQQGVPVAQSWASTAGAGAGVGGVAVAGRRSDFAIFESNVVRYRFTEGAEAPAAIRIGLWAYLVVGTRRGSRKATGA